MDMGAWLEAQTYLEDLILRGSYLDPAQFNLGRVFQELQQPDNALSAYNAVTFGDNYLAAQQRIALLMISDNKLKDVTTHFDIQRKQYPDVAVQLYLIETENLSNHKKTDSAWLRINQALKLYPGDPSLLYTRAMIADQRNDLVQLEEDLRSIIERDPSNAMALNALGYTLADRTERLDEARVLIEKAHQLEPDDAAITDSLGWLYYRLGDLVAAERLLREALDGYPDAEIAAHLGEVLWQLGKHKEAQRIWNTARKAQPEHVILLETIQRLTHQEP